MCRVMMMMRSFYLFLQKALRRWTRRAQMQNLKKAWIAQRGNKDNEVRVYTAWCWWLDYLYLRQRERHHRARQGMRGRAESARSTAARIHNVECQLGFPATPRPPSPLCSSWSAFAHSTVAAAMHSLALEGARAFSFTPRASASLDGA